MAKMYGKGKTAIESEEQQKLRWQVELEFVQCLANPNYLNFLAQRGYFKDQAFINYIKYLQYWKEPDYAKYLMYPMCLYFLDLLQFEHFRREIVSAQCCKFIDEQAILQWQHYTRKRIKMLNAVSEGVQQTDVQTGGAGAVASIPGVTAVGSEATTAEQIQQQQQPQPQSAQKTNPATGGLQNGLNAGQSGLTQPQTQPPMQQQTQQQQQQGSTAQQQINGISANSSVGMGNIKLELT